MKRQQARQLAHSYADEIVRRPVIEPVHFTRRDLIEIVVGTPVMAVLLFGLPFLLWLIGGGA